MIGGDLLTAFLSRQEGAEPSEEATAGAAMVAAFMGAVYGALTKK